MATSNSTKVNDIVINRTTEELLKTMEIQPNQFYLTPDDNTSGEAISVAQTGKSVELAYNDRLNTAVFTVNPEQNETTLQNFFTTHTKAADNRCFTGLMMEQFNVPLNSTITPNNLIAGSTLMIALWVALHYDYKDKDYSSVLAWGEVDAFEPVNVDTQPELMYDTSKMNYIKYGNNTFSWKRFSVNQNGSTEIGLYFVIEFDTLKYTLTLPCFDIGEVKLEDILTTNATGATLYALDAIQKNILNIGAANGGIALGNDASLGFTKEPGEDETLTANDYIDAIQIGAGTNTNPKTLQIYDYQLLDAAGKIPNERFNIDLSEVDNKLLNKVDILRFDEDATGDKQYYKVINNQEHMQLGFYSGNSEEFLAATKRIKAIGIADNIAISMIDDMEAGDALKASMIDIDYGTMALNTINGDINISAQNGAVAINSVGSDVGIVTDTGNFVWNGKQVAVIDDVPIVLDLSSQTIVTEEE